jgi:hypothetical protein
VKVVAAAISAETHTHPSVQTHNKTKTSPPQFPPQLFQASSNIAAAAAEEHLRLFFPEKMMQQMLMRIHRAGQSTCIMYTNCPHILLPTAPAGGAFE